jgi:hypothetical protein
LVTVRAGDVWLKLAVPLTTTGFDGAASTGTVPKHVMARKSARGRDFM